MVEPDKDLVFPATQSWLSSSRMTRREFISDLESRMREYPQIDVPTEDYFSNGVYLRKCFIAKGTMLVGEIHKFSHLNILVSGSLRVITEFGISTLTSNDVFESAAGTKKVGYAIEDTHFITVHSDDSTDAVDIRKRHTTTEYVGIAQED